MKWILGLWMLAGVAEGRAPNVVLIL
ncbi:MAG: hypothetical protein RLZZ476_1541, partial [Verrucomicrobiota bacterium]